MIKKKKLADSLGLDYIETSAKNKFNCKETFEKLVKLILKTKIKKKNKKQSHHCSFF